MTARRKSRTYSGFYPVKNKSKYKGNPNNVIYRSLWERRVMEYLDFSPIVKSWGSEEIIIPYKSSIDNKVHRYFMDFVVVLELPDKSTLTYLLEIKPKKQTVFPTTPARKTKRYYDEVKTFIVNQDKWIATKKYCEIHGYIFKIITEDELFNMTIF